MKHDELLALINDEIEVCEPECNKHRWANAPWLALRAVVKLHKPLSEEMSFCVSCQTSYNGEPDVVVWPCPLIKIIEKELS